MRKIPKKNYLYLVLIIFVTVGLLILFVNIYNSQNENNSKNIMSSLKEIKNEEFENYIRENLDFILYISNSSEYRNLEIKLNKALKKKDYNNSMIYINYDEIDDDFINILNKHSINKIERIPNIIIFDGGMISYYDYFNEDITSDDVIRGIENNYD